MANKQTKNVKSPPKKKGKSELVDGDNLLYRVFTELTELPEDVSEPVIELMIKRTAIWFRPECYAQTPLMLPWVVRDPSCRGPKGQDQWAAPDELGYLRDDNSLIKPIPRSFTVTGPKDSWYFGKRIGPGFVASHIWRETKAVRLASREPQLNSFVPNLVWLPRQIAKLSDREGGKIQKVLQSISWSIYRDTSLVLSNKEPIEKIWNLIPSPKTIANLKMHELNYFSDTTQHHDRLHRKLGNVIEALDLAMEGRVIPDSLNLETRYKLGLKKVPRENLKDLMDFLRQYYVN